MSKLLILHGALGSAHQFEQLSGALTIAHEIVEFIGHGTTPDINDPWTIDVFANQLKREIDDRGLSTVSIFGYSMGGYVALRCSMLFPELISNIVTLGTKLQWSPQQAQKETALLNPDIISQKVPRFAEDLQRRHGESHWTRVLQKTADLMVSLGAAPVLVPQEMNSCTSVVRYMVGDSDEMVSLEETIEFYRSTPTAQLVVMPTTKHPIEKVNAGLLAAQIQQFLST